MMKFGKIKLGKAPRVAGVIVNSINEGGLKRAVRTGADLLELRLDTLQKRNPASILDAVKAFRSDGGVPIILTIRSKIEGGRYAVKDSERLRLFTSLMPFVDGVDIELGSRKILNQVIRSARKYRKRVIVSYHNFKTTPRKDALNKTISRARRSGADMVKIAAQAKTRPELKRLASLLLEGNDLIVIAMGSYGTSTRVFFPILGSLITYGSVTGSAAPGQLPVRDIKRQLGVFGIN
jgi:3-dehydroquinate dehydratase-1